MFIVIVLPFLPQYILAVWWWGGEIIYFASIQASRPRGTTLKRIWELLLLPRDPGIELNIVTKQNIGQSSFGEVVMESSTNIYFVCRREDFGKSNNAHQVFYKFPYIAQTQCSQTRSNDLFCLCKECIYVTSEVKQLIASIRGYSVIVLETKRTFFDTVELQY